MILIIGGAYQGKRDFARRELGAKAIRDWADIDGGMDEYILDGDGVCGLEAFARECVRSDVEASDWFREREEDWADKILIMGDISQGIVPTDPELRAWREMNGRLMLYLAGEADEVIRVFCGIGKRIG